VISSTTTSHFSFQTFVRGFLAGAGLAEGRLFEVIGQDLLQTMTHYRVIVCDEDLHEVGIQLAERFG